MARICLYDVDQQERNDFTDIPDVHDIHFFEEELTSENVDSEAEIVSVFVSSTVDKALLDKMPKLKLIAARSTGFNNIDLASCSERGITIVNVPTYGEHTVAEYAFALLLTLTKKILHSAKQMNDGEIDHSLLHGIDLQGKTLGVIGAGRIGQNVIKLGKAFGMNVLAYDPYLKSEIAKEQDIQLVELQELISSSDVISLHVPLTKENIHMVNTALISNMKDGVFIINTARGELIDTNALLSALKSGKVAGAGLDVLEDEKLMDFDEEQLLLKKGKAGKEALEHVLANTILMKMPNVILTSHNAYNTTEAISRINHTTVENIISYLAGSVQNKVGV